jgi:hypothetical protein
MGLASDLIKMCNECGGAACMKCKEGHIVDGKCDKCGAEATSESNDKPDGPNFNPKEWEKSPRGMLHKSGMEIKKEDFDKLVKDMNKK